MDLRMKEYHNVIDPNTHAEMIVDTSDDSIAVDVSNIELMLILLKRHNLGINI